MNRLVNVTRRILIVEDNPELRESLRDLLEEEGYELHTASDIDSGLKLLNQLDFVLVIADLMEAATPESWAALDVLREAARPAPVGIVTGWNLDPGAAETRGYAFQVTKVIEIEELLGKVASHAQPREVSATDAAVIHRYFANLEARNWSALASECAEDVVYNLPSGSTFSTTVTGRRAFESFSEQTFRGFPDCRFRVQALLPLPKATIARYTAQWNDAQGQPREMVGAVLFLIEAGAIGEIGVRLELRQQVTQGLASEGA